MCIRDRKYDSMIEDLLTMAELLDMVSDMRIKDVRAIQELGKFIPAYAAYERNRLSVYRNAAKEAESIICLLYTSPTSAAKRTSSNWSIQSSSIRRERRSERGTVDHD